MNGVAHAMLTGKAETSELADRVVREGPAARALDDRDFCGSERLTATQERGTRDVQPGLQRRVCHAHQETRRALNEGLPALGFPARKMPRRWKEIICGQKL